MAKGQQRIMSLEVQDRLRKIERKIRYEEEWLWMFSGIGDELAVRSTERRIKSLERAKRELLKTGKVR